MTRGPRLLDWLIAEAEACVERLEPQDLHRLLDDPRLILIDVREPAELAAGTIPGAVNIPRSTLEWALDPGDAGYHPAFARPGRHVFYCGGGGRSLLSAHLAHRFGLARIASLHGGFRQWTAENRPVAGGPAPSSDNNPQQEG